MKTIEEQGGYAFPAVGTPDGALYEGMTLRDNIAIHAMQAIVSSPNCPMVSDDDIIASQSYKLADAMLKAREE